ncbi:pentapeptide repeat-containing protein [Scytonema sp. UIC 10036]|uniref:pentapeptide repeat-containing protein n=1 Tax=Scytonema sp. UIC 10036 TaxID=2304196 RepID=UPI001A9AA7E4|nr:pentapeptide repeat-containing protein [Scytonema sp. UIC 10036]
MKYQPHPTNLKSGNFKGKDFTGADFSHADIRGADFSNAVLIGTNFCNSKAGLPHFWVISLTGLSIIMAFLAGIVSGYAAALIGDLLSNHSYGFYFFGLFSLITLVLFFSVIFWRGLGVMLVTIADVLVACLIVAVAFLPNKEPGLFLTVDAQFTAIALAGAMVSVINMAVAVALAKVLVIPLATTSTGLTSFIGIILGVSLGVRSNELIYIQAVLIALTLMNRINLELKKC